MCACAPTRGDQLTGRPLAALGGRGSDGSVFSGFPLFTWGEAARRAPRQGQERRASAAASRYKHQVCVDWWRLTSQPALLQLDVARRLQQRVEEAHVAPRGGRARCGRAGGHAATAGHARRSRGRRRPGPITAQWRGHVTRATANGEGERPRAGRARSMPHAPRRAPAPHPPSPDFATWTSFVYLILFLCN